MLVIPHFVEKPPYTPIAYIVSDTNVLTMQLLNKPVPRYYNGEKAEQLDSVSAKTIINIRISFHPQEALKRPCRF